LTGRWVHYSCIRANASLISLDAGTGGRSRPFEAAKSGVQCAIDR
jgi:hypothetical protein